MRNEEERINAEDAAVGAQRAQRKPTAKTPASKAKAGGRYKFKSNCKEPPRRRRYEIGCARRYGVRRFTKDIASRTMVTAMQSQLNQSPKRA